MWLNGQLAEPGAIAASGTVAASGAGLTLGWGVFTTLGVREGRPRFLARHVLRLERDAREADVPFDLDFDSISLGLGEVLRANSIKNGLARLTLTRRGDERWNTDSGADFSILALETPPLAGAMRVQMSPYRVEARRALCGVKTTSYLDYLQTHREAKARGFDDAILRNGRDFLSEAARATLFWAKNQVLYTPSLLTGCLRGIGRELAVEWAKSSGLEVREGEFAASQAAGASEIWLVSAATGPRPVGSWHDENGDPITEFLHSGPLTGQFARWFEARND